MDYYNAELVEIKGRAQTRHYVMRSCTMKSNAHDILKGKKPCNIILDLKTINTAVCGCKLLCHVS